ncbi:MAG: hypothetical protein MHM6MM_006390, partial [Cercozoa sp. M6MM]
ARAGTEATLRAQLQSAQKQIESARKQIQQQRDHSQQLTKEKQQAQDATKQARDKCDELSRQLREASGVCAEKNAALAEQRSRVKKAESLAENFRVDLQQLRHRCTVFEQQHVQQQQRAEHAHEAHRKTCLELEEANQRVKELQLRLHNSTRQEE